MVDIAIDDLDALLFDLGGVIVELDYSRTIEQLSLLIGFDAGQVYTQQKQTPLFTGYETGTLSTAEFRKQLKSQLNFEAPDNAIDAAWNALILSFPPERVALIRQLRQRLPVYLLSNNNELHLARCYELFEQTFGNELGTLDNQFERAYYSHQMCDRKPNASIYQRVIDEQGLDPAHTLFVEDTAHNIVGAEAVGLQTLHITDGLRIEDIDWAI
ncbi:MAG: HAD family phosphatase [Cyanobacteria bacterium J06628_6]